MENKSLAPPEMASKYFPLSFSCPGTFFPLLFPLSEHNLSWVPTAPRWETWLSSACLYTSALTAQELS